MMDQLDAEHVSLSDDECDEIEHFLTILQGKKLAWVDLSFQRKITILARLRQNLATHAAEWVALVNKKRGIDQKSPWAAEEWYEIYTIARALHGYQESLQILADGNCPTPPGKQLHESGQAVAHTFPQNLIDWLLFNGISTAVWLGQGVTEETLFAAHAGPYRQADYRGALALVLGAGNVNSIAPLDALGRLFGQVQVVLLKLSPINAYLRPLLEKIFSPLIQPGFLRIIDGEEAVGRYLVQHADVDEIHLTGSAATYRAIQNGFQKSGVAAKSMSSELGGVTPVVVLPGRWTAADIRFQAENIATMKLYNAGHNCIAAQLLLLPADWSPGERLIQEIQNVFQSLPPQPDYYPGAGGRRNAAVEYCPHYREWDSGVPRTLVSVEAGTDAAQYCAQNEFFGPVLAVMTLPAATLEAYLQTAVDYCNQSVVGTLGVDVICSPDVLREKRAAVETAIARLQYGIIGLNAWCGLIYRLTENPWGAFQEPAAMDIGSGRGVVHNTLLFAQPQKCVVRGRFRPFPRSWLHGDPAFFPKPPWFVTHRNRIATARRVAGLALDPSLLRLPAIFVAALRG